MNPFTYTCVDSIDSAVGEIAADHGAKFIAGGTNLVDLMKENVERPNRLIDINHLPMRSIKRLPDGRLRIGALVTNTDVAYSEDVQSSYPLLSKAILAGASPQLRNMATVGGNLMQRTRCCYFYDTATPCNKRAPGTGCPAIPGFNRMHAILGTSDQCIATHPSDMCVAMAALDAVIHVAGKSEREIPFADFHRLPGQTPHMDTNLGPDEIIVAVDLPANGFVKHNAYLKIRDRASYAFALVAVAAALEIDSGVIREARIALGGVAHKPWRDRDAEAMLKGRSPSRDIFSQVAKSFMRDAKGFGHNDFKIELAKRSVVRALCQAAAGT